MLDMLGRWSLVGHSKLNAQQQCERSDAPARPRTHLSHALMGPHAAFAHPSSVHALTSPCSARSAIWSLPSPSRGVCTLSHHSDHIARRQCLNFTNMPCKPRAHSPQVGTPLAHHDIAMHIPWCLHTVTPFRSHRSSPMSELHKHAMQASCPLPTSGHTAGSSRHCHAHGHLWWLGSKAAIMPPAYRRCLRRPI